MLQVDACTQHAFILHQTKCDDVPIISNKNLRNRNMGYKHKYVRLRKQFQLRFCNTGLKTHSYL